MEQGMDVRVDDVFVIHVLDNRLQSPQCSHALTPLPEELRLRLEEYFAALLQPTARRRRFARFQPQSPVLQAYQRLLQTAASGGRIDPAVFLKMSQELAQGLFEAMRQAPQMEMHSRPGDITPGDLLMGLAYPAQSPPPVMPYLFLVKIALEAGLQRQLRHLEHGGMQMILTPCEGLIPRLTAEHVHKVALIRWANDPQAHDIVMADYQSGRRRLAKFFAEDFLHSQAFHTPDEQADLLFKRTQAWVVDHEDALTPREQQDVLESVRSLITARAAHAEPLAARELVFSLPLSEPRAEPVVHELRRSFQETLMAPEANGDSIPVDRELLLHSVPPRVGKTRLTFQLDDGVQLSGDREAIERLFLDPPHRVGQQTEFTIRTTTFRPLV